MSGYLIDITDGARDTFQTPKKQEPNKRSIAYPASKWATYTVTYGLALVAIHFSIATLFNKYKGREVISPFMSQLQAGATVTWFSAFVDSPYFFKDKDIRLSVVSGWDLSMYVKLLGSVFLGAAVPSLVSRFGSKASVKVLPTLSFALVDLLYIWGIENFKGSKPSTSKD